MYSKDDILIVEDSPAIGMLLKNYLEKLGYVQIHTCTNGLTSIETFKELVTLGKHPIVLLDYMLPDMDRGQMDDVLHKRARSQLIEALKDEALRTLLRRLESRGISLESLIEQIKSREKDPYTLVQDVLANELRDFTC